jgi:hypothetical protein
MPVTDGDRKLLQVFPFQDTPAVVDQNEVVAASLHFIKRYFLHG